MAKLILRALRDLALIAAVIVPIALIGELSIIQIKADTPAPPVPVPTSINPNFINQVNQCFIPVADLNGYTLRITSGWRSLQDQGQIYQQGRIVDGHIVSEAGAGRSIHNYGFAVDVVDRWNGYDINWPKLVNIATYCGLEHDDSDMPHFEHRGGLTTSDFMAGKRPALLTLPCPIMAERSSASDPLTKQDLKSCNAPTF